MGDEIESKRTKCQRFSRIVGYIRPVSEWNAGKTEEFEDRKTFDTSKCGCN
jgi:anaerobic ribonucleoside-triphosphate reductase